MNCVFAMAAFVFTGLKMDVKMKRVKKPIYKRKCFHNILVTCSNANDSFSWEGWKLSHLFRQFLKKTGHFPLHNRHSYVFPQPDNVLKLPPAKTAPEKEFQKLAEEIRFKEDLQSQQPSSTDQQQLVCISNASATLFGQLIQYSQDKSKVWVRPLLLIQEEIDMFQLDTTAGTMNKSYYSLVSSQDLLLPSQLVVPYSNGLTGLLNILPETACGKFDTVQQREIASQVLFRFLQSFHQ